MATTKRFVAVNGLDNNNNSINNNNNNNKIMIIKILNIQKTKYKSTIEF